MSFFEQWCANCARDNFNKDTMKGGCSIMARSLRFKIDEPGYPKEWIERKDWDQADALGDSPRCTAFVPREALRLRALRAWETIRRRRRESFAGQLL
jgi:hypothetical protein